MVKSSKMFLISFVLATLIFFAGFVLSWGFDLFRNNELGDMIKQNELNTQSYLVEQDFIKGFGGDKCKLARPRLNELSSELAYLGRLLTQFSEKGMFEREDYNYLKQKYFLLEIRSFVLFNEIIKECKDETHIILFFYETESMDSTKQGYILDELVNKANKEVYVFSFDINFDREPSLETLKLRFGIKSAPSIVIDGEVIKEGFINLEDLEGLIG